MLQDQATSKLNRLKELRDFISASVKFKELNGLLAVVREALQLETAAEDLHKLCRQLIEREQKNAAAVASILENARLLRQQCQFEAAEKSLGQISEELRTEESTNLQIDCQNLGLSKNEALWALSKAMQTEDYQQGLTLASAYRMTLAEEGLTDGSFNQAYTACQSAKKIKLEAAAAAKRQRTMVIRAGIGIAALVVVVITVGAYLAIQSSAAAAKVANIEKALDNGDYQTALQLDPANAEALFMKKGAEIKERIERSVQTFEGHTDDVNSVAYSADGNSIVSGSSDYSLKIWDAKTGKEKLTLNGHIDVVTSVAYSPDGNSIVSGSRVKRFKIWDVKTGKEKLTFTGDIGRVSSVAYSPDGNSIVSGSSNGTIKIWDLTPLSSD